MPVTWGANKFGTDPGQSFYKRPYGPDGRLLPQAQWWGYSRTTMVTNQPERWTRRWANLKAAFPAMAPTDRILVVGCAYGFLIEVALDDGYTAIWGIDNSAYVDANAATEMRADVQARFLANDITGGGSMRAQLRSLTGDDQFDWIITEGVAESFAPGQEMDGLLGATEAGLLAGVPNDHIIHLVTVNPGGQSAPPQWVTAGMTWLELSEWNQIRPSHSWVDLATWTVA